jgi:membrane associated rhomboid family serine protease
MVRIIILINIAVFAAWQFGSESTVEFLNQNFLISLESLREGRYWTLITSVFSHNWLIHLLVNMFVLNSFGPILHRVLGPKRFIVFYLGAGIISSLSHSLVSGYLMGRPEMRALGASGSIAGLILLFSLMFPKERILLFAIIPMPALVGALAFVGLDVWGLIAQVEGGGLPIGHGAHLGGSLTGAIYYFAYIRPRWLRSPLRHILEREP